MDTFLTAGAVIVIICVFGWACFIAGIFWQMKQYKVYGYYDHFNDVFYEDIDNAIEANNGGNKISIVYLGEHWEATLGAQS